MRILEEDTGIPRFPGRATVFWAGVLKALKGTLGVPNPVSALLCVAVQASHAGLVLALWLPGAGAGWRLLPEPLFSPVSFSELFCPGGPLALSSIGEWILLESWRMSQATEGR